MSIEKKLKYRKVEMCFPKHFSMAKRSFELCISTDIVLVVTLWYPFGEHSDVGLLFFVCAKRLETGLHKINN